jgi:hypothetical protein
MLLLSAVLMLVNAVAMPPGKDCMAALEPNAIRAISQGIFDQVLALLAVREIPESHLKLQNHVADEIYSRLLDFPNHTRIQKCFLIAPFAIRCGHLLMCFQNPDHRNPPPFEIGCQVTFTGHRTQLAAGQVLEIPP